MSSNWVRQLAIAALTSAVLAAVVALGQVPLGHGSGQATLRVALRTVQSNAEICTERTEAELEALPAHMRQKRVCEQIAPPFTLRISIDGNSVLDETFEPGGLRGDRPLTVDRKIRLAPGPARLEVRFSPRVEVRLAEQLARAQATLPSYRLEEQVDFRPDRIVLVRLDDAVGRLEIYRDR